MPTPTACWSSPRRRASPGRPRKPLPGARGNVALGIDPNLRLSEAQQAEVRQSLADVGLDRMEHRLPGLAGRIAVISPGVDHVWRIAPAPDALEALGLEPGRYVLAVEKP